mmetsp:Transcript_14899/g.23178  ORF Transcript_14899/g.23178 Transcript_14899/m.23178 type:complete len:292 (-) Transcript_14899:4-879(-)
MKHAVALEPGSAIYNTNLGIAHQHAGQFQEAAQASKKAALLQPDHAEIQQQLGRAMEEIEELEEALEAYTAVTKLDPSHEDGFCAMVFVRHFLCSWKGWRSRMKKLENLLRNKVLKRKGWGGTCDQPFRLFSYPLPADLTRDVSRHVVRKELASLAGREVEVPRVRLDPDTKRLRIGYMSSDFGGHTVGSLVKGVLTSHNPFVVDVFAIVLKTEDRVKAGSSREEIKSRVKAWVDCETLNDEEAAEQIQKHRIHILIDLNGHSKGARTGVLIRKPAPIVWCMTAYMLMSYL